MGLISGIFGGGIGDRPEDVNLNTVNLGTGRLGDVEQMYFDKAQTDPTQISTSGQAQLDLNESRRLQDLSRQSGLNQGMFSSFANQMSEGGGSAGDMIRAKGLFDRSNQGSLQNINQNVSNQNLATTAQDFGTQQANQQQAFMNLPSVASMIPSIENQQEMTNVGILNQQDLANQQAQTMYNQAQTDSSGNLLSTVGGLAGGAAGLFASGGNPYMGMLGMQAGKAL